MVIGRIGGKGDLGGDNCMSWFRLHVVVVVSTPATIGCVSNDNMNVMNAFSRIFENFNCPMMRE